MAIHKYWGLWTLFNCFGCLSTSLPPSCLRFIYLMDMMIMSGNTTWSYLHTPIGSPAADLQTTRHKWILMMMMMIFCGNTLSSTQHHHLWPVFQYTITTPGYESQGPSPALIIVSTRTIWCGNLLHWLIQLVLLLIPCLWICIRVQQLNWTLGTCSLVLSLIMLRVMCVN